MSSPKYAQIHRQLLFHWTAPKKLGEPRKRSEHLAYLDLLKGILNEGLRFSTPGSEHAEWIERGKIEASRPMICLSEWGLADSRAHAGRYGKMGFGFTRKFIMKKGGRPVIYVPNARNDQFRKSLIEVLRMAKETPGLEEHYGILASSLKAYHFPRDIQKARPDIGSKKTGTVPRRPKVLPEDSGLRLDFGGIFSNLEDREWRILRSTNRKSVSPGQPVTLECSPGNLAMIVLPDHQTLSLALQDEGIREHLFVPEQPAVCLVSKEMIFSI